jgi:carotenoid cleavage dioxygenase
MMFFGYSLAQAPYLQYGWISAAGELQKTVSIDLPLGVMMHDFAITEQYTIFMDLPLTFRPERIQQGGAEFEFEQNRPSRFGIMPRHGDNETIRWFESSPCYIFHTLNAYEEGEEVVLIACRMSSTSVLGMLKIDAPNGDIPQLYQWRFNLNTGEVKEELLEEIPSEFPRINEQYIGRKNRYGYTAKMADSPLPLMDGIIKHDLSSGNSQIHQFETGCYGGEAVFVPHPQGTSEDEGWLVTFVYDERLKTSSFVIINAQDITGKTLAKVTIPQRVPYGFHGIWLPQSKL